MTVQTSEILHKVSQELHLAEDEVMIEGMKAIVERKLLELNTQIFEISNRYQVTSVVEMEKQYEQGILKEADSWDDFQRLDHLEYRRDQLMQLLNVIQQTAISFN